MFRQIIILSIFVLPLFFKAAHSEECNISGIWKHSAKPAKLYIDLGKSEISVHSHEVEADSVGLVVMDNLKRDSKPSFWKAKMYNAATDSMVDVQITSKKCDQLNISYNGEQVLQLVR